MINEIRKRSGTVTAFNKDKISNAKQVKTSLAKKTRKKSIR